MPTAVTFFGTWRLDWVAVAALLLALVGYSWAVLRVRRQGGRWPVRATAWFVLAGLGSYAVISLGFLGAHSTGLRWAFTTRIALLLLVVPGLTLLGRPLDLARTALPAGQVAVLDRVVGSAPVRLLGNAIVAPVFACAVFLVFLTPWSGAWRASSVAEGVSSVAVPVVGLLFVLPIVAHSGVRSEVFIAAEFLFAFLELVLDSIPGLVLRLSDHVLDGAGAVAGALPSWFPGPLADQHWSGDFLWAIAEVSDVPILIALFVRWARTDGHRARALDELSEAEMAELTRAHLRREG